MAENTDVVVIGRGYTGVIAANRQTQNDHVTVTLVNPRPVFVPRLRQARSPSGPPGSACPIWRRAAG